ncbi:hypothetical protein ACFWN1_11460 [Streptomyces sp. NPDC058459]|uniref:hypothetical protein n=1 Tax=Streptomyces sp. NPDC058459 TaxID=3346508 RepID=UPI00365BEDD0
MTSGRHSFRVRATHVWGRTSTSAAVTVTADATRPSYPTAPTMRLGKGTVDTAGVPVTVDWKPADDNGLRSQAAATRAGASGAVRIYVDGTLQTTIDLKSATTPYRHAMWSNSWSSAASTL